MIFRLNDVIDEEWRNEKGNEFQILGAATEKEDSPYFLVLVVGVFNNRRSDDDLRVRFGVYVDRISEI